MRINLKPILLLHLLLFLTAGFCISLPAYADDSAALIKQGRNLAQGCTRCHGRYGIQKAAEQEGMGSDVGMYTERELGDFKSGRRQHPIMSAIAQTLSEDDIRAISAWLDSL